MKQFFLILSMLIIVVKLHGQSTWEYLIPDNTNGTSARSSFINDQEGWIIMVNQIWHTQDGGITWEKNLFEYNIDQFEFKNGSVGYAISQHDPYGFGKEVYKTIDAGITWNVLDVPDSAYHSIYFLNTDTGFISGSGKIYKTEDGGVNWSIIPFSYAPVVDFHFMNDSIGFAVNDSHTIYKSTDKGLTWFSVNESIDNNYYTNIFFLDENIGIAYGYHSDDPDYLTIEKTTDGGNNWNTQYEGNDEHIIDMIFRGSEGFAITDNESYLSSSDGGSSWVETSLSGITGEVFAFDGFNNLFAFGNLGEMYKLSADSVTWEAISQPYEGITAIRNHSFATPDTGWVLDYYTGVFKTTDGGITWTLVSNKELDLIDAVTTELIFAVRGSSIYDDSCSVYSSSDGGITWNLLFTHNFGASQFQMIDENTGYILSYDGSIFKTTDAGINWSETEIGTGNFTAMHFLDENEGWVLKGDWGDNAVYHTTDGGSTWDMIYEYTGFGWYLVDVYFLDSQHGWIVHSAAQSDNDADYSATDNGGVTWTDHLLSSNFFYFHRNHDVYFANLQHGWIVDERVLYETTDGGNTWQEVFYGPWYLSRRLEFVSPQAIYVSGEGTWMAKGSYCTVISSFTSSVSGQSVQFTDQSENTTSWLWDFGDGNTSTEQSPSHTYSTGGDFNVCLITTGDCGMDTFCQSIFLDYPLNTPSSNDPELIEYSLFPNPISTSTIIQFSLSENCELSLELFDVSGKKINTVLHDYFEVGTYSRTIDLKELPAAFYIIKATALGQSNFIKVIKQ